MLMGAVGSLILGGYGVYLFWLEQLEVQLLIWLAVLVLSCSANYYYAIRTAGRTGHQALRALNYFTLLGLIAGLIWSIPAFWLASGQPESIASGYGTIFIIVATMGMATSAMGSTSAYLPMYYCSVSPFLIALISACFIADISHLALVDIGIALLIFVLAIFWFTYNINLGLIKAIDLHHDNLVLAKSYRREKESAEEANHQKSQFLAAASHDLRQPLHALGLYSEVLLTERCPQKITYLIERMHKSTSSLRSMLDAILDLSKVQAKVIKPNNDSFEVRLLFQLLKENFQQVAIDKKLRLIFHGQHHFCHSDLVLVQRILSNFISNAIRYTNSGGVLITARKRNENLLFQVWDTGIGIELIHQTKIFNEYFQVGNAERNREQGLGLGLSIVKGIANTLATKIKCRSKLASGSCFSFELPKGIAAVQHTPNENYIFPSILTDKCILLIDDDTEILKAAKALLSSWDISMETACNASEAKQLLKTGFQPDLLISDYRLAGGENGITVLNELNRQNETILPRILLTGDTASERLKEASSSGLLLLHKPIQAAKLRIAINRLLAG